jgi:serine/threonine-protein kinase
VLAPGQWIDCYELVALIGEGGMAHVWAAREGERILALKVIHSRFAEDANFRAMFLDEARIVSAIAHPNVARVHGLGTAGQGLFLAMEYVDGESLAALIAPQKTVPLPVALRVVADACAGLHAVHRTTDPLGQALNIVHRDVSPQNMLITANGTVKLIDFGIAHARDRAAAATTTGQIKGKVRYMAPEQARQEPVGPPTDVFAAGAVLFRLLAGHPPYAANDYLATLQALLTGAPPLVQLPPDVPPAVTAVLERALAPQPSMRIPTAQALGDALEALIAQLPRPPDVSSWVAQHETREGAARRAAIAQHQRPPLLELPSRGGGTAPLAEPLRMPARSGGPDERDERSFMDVGALARGAGPRVAAPMPSPGERPRVNEANARPPDDAEGGSAAPARDVMPSPSAPAPAPARLAPGPHPAAGGGSARAAVFAIALVLVVVGLLLVLPTIVRERAIAMAHEAGFTMKVEHTGIGFGGATLRGVTLTSPSLPGVRASVDEIGVLGLFRRDLRFYGLKLEATGAPADLLVPLSLLVDENRARFAGTPDRPRKLGLTGAQLTWTGLAGPGSKLEVADAVLDIDSRGARLEETRGSVGRLSFKSGPNGRELGPWAATYESSPTTSRLRIMFDPPVADGPSALIVGLPPLVDATVRIPRARFAHLGFGPEDLGLPADADTEIDVTLEAHVTAARSELKGQAALYGARVGVGAKGAARRMDVRADLGLHGVAGKPLELDHTSVTVGPFNAGVTGTLTPYEKGVRLDAMVRAAPIGCDRIAKASGGLAGSVASALDATGGAIRLTGNVNLNGVVKWDSAAPDESSVTWLAKESCGVSIFGM